MAVADITQMQNLRPQEALTFMEMGHETLRQMETMSKPVIAAVNGFALGGGTEIALACDIRFASEKATFGQPEILIGLIPGWGGTQRLPRIIGMGRAKELILGGVQISAQRAYEIGLVNRLFNPGELLPETQKFARKLAAMPKASPSRWSSTRWISATTWRSTTPAGLKWSAAPSASARTIRRRG